MSFSIADIKVYVANVSALAAYICLPDLMEMFRLANTFFQETQFIWKALAPLSAFLYTFIRMRNDKKSSSNSNNRMDSK